MEFMQVESQGSAFSPTIQVALSLAPEDMQSLIGMACDLDEADACMLLAGMSEADTHENAADGFYTQACDLEDTRACHALWLRRLETADSAESKRQAAGHLELAYSDGIGAACRTLSLLYAKEDGDLHNVELAIARTQDACNLGALARCGDLGMRYLSGEGVKHDERRGRALITYTCASGFAENCVGIAQNILSEPANQVEKAHAAMFFLRAACLGVSDRGCKGFSVLTALDNRDDDQATITALGVLLDQNPQNGAARAILASSLIAHERIETAREVLNTGLRNRNVHPALYGVSAELALRMGDDATARTHADIFLEHMTCDVSANLLWMRV